MNKKLKMLAVIALSSAIGMGAMVLPACSANETGDLPDNGLELPEEFPSVLPDELPEGDAGAGDVTEEEGEAEEEQPEDEVVEEEEEEEEVVPPAPQTIQYIAVVGSNVNVRSGAGTEFAILGQAKQSTLFAIVGKVGKWYITYYKNGLGYIHADYCRNVSIKSSGDERVERVISDATKLLGVKYVYGAVRYHDGNGNKLSGFSVYAFDCSSLLQYAFKTGANYNLQVTTRTQVKQGKTVPASQLKRGDLMFFTNAMRYNNTGVERIGHVALYLGDNYILHTSSQFAKIEKLTTSRWNYYVQSQRIF